jgi:membrane protein required for colicin V production
MNELLNADLPVNLFDGAIYLFLAVAIISGLRSGLLRSLATIFGYVIAAPVAVMIMPHVAPILTERLRLPPAQSSLGFFAVFVVVGFILGALLRGAVGEISGSHISAPDRAAGAFLGAIRVMLLAVVMVMVFERIIPAGREPAFLKGSTLRPVLSQAGQEGLRKLPPDVTEFIDRMKRERGL